MNRARVVALYLPQYHPIPENDDMWGKGFTEWRRVVSAKPLYPGHYQPKLTADLGYYDLRLQDTRAEQAELARSSGVEAFCYYHYWFAGRRLLQRPFEEVLRSGEPDFPFCLCWANESWTGIWVGEPDKIIAEQTYPGVDDHSNHFDTLLPAFRDKRYLRIDGKPVFFVYRPAKIPDVVAFVRLWRHLAERAGLPGIYFVGVNHRSVVWEPGSMEFDAAIANRLPDTRPWISKRTPLRWARFRAQAMLNWPTIYDADEVISRPVYDETRSGEWFPTVYPNWDTTARHRSRGLVMDGSSPEIFRAAVRRALDLVVDRPADHRLIVLKSWNEWAEGNYVEPDQRFGHAFLDVLREEVKLPDTA